MAAARSWVRVFLRGSARVGVAAAPAADATQRGLGRPGQLRRRQVLPPVLAAAAPGVRHQVRDALPPVKVG